MATRSMIFVKENKKYKGIYCHNFGYPSYNGVILRNNYKSKEKARKLIALGNISKLGENIEACEAVKKFGFLGIYADNFKTLSKEQQCICKKEYDSSSYTIAYHRDAGEKLENCIVTSLSKYIKESKMIEFIYVFNDSENCWKCYDSSKSNTLKTNLTSLSNI